jgi:hypothetical protein
MVNEKFGVEQGASVMPKLPAFVIIEQSNSASPRRDLEDLDQL